jgi:predicted dehydrogenase
MGQATGELDLSLRYLPVLPKRRDWRIGCLGTGFIMADCHLVAYRNAGFNPVAIAARDPQKAAVVAERHSIPSVYASIDDLLADDSVEVLDIALPPDVQLPVVRKAVKQAGHVKGILAQKPLGMNYAEAREIVELCEGAGIALGVNQNMRYDQSIRACRDVIDRGWLGEPVFASIDMRAIPHWMPWQERLGWLTLRIMSIHHIDAFRYLLGDPVRIFASARSDPRTKFAHEDGICLYIMEYANGARAASWDDVWTGPAREGAEGDISIRWRVEGVDGMARGTIGWPSYPAPTPSTIDFTTKQRPGYWFQPRWKEVWFPDAFVGPMAQLLRALEQGSEPEIGGRDNLKTMALVDAAYLSLKEHRAVELAEIHKEP